MAPHENRSIAQLRFGNTSTPLLDDLAHEHIEFVRSPVAQREALHLHLIKHVCRVEIRHRVLAHVRLVRGSIPVALPLERVPSDQVGHEDARTVEVIVDILDQST